ncbi:MAG: GAF domain-containing protein [Anaerolineae bacterium]|nr:GAF domain-containing protein [Gloeobacterales cyanobacterium ES-bin-313]
MIDPEKPDNEQHRLAILRSINILDTPIEERFERVTRLVSRVLCVPIAAISLVDDSRQWFKSIRGYDVKETARNHSFCAHAILGQETFIVEDTTLDERFSENPFVVNPPSIRFYAGYPLCISKGANVGTLCVYDVVPRALGSEDLQFLEDMAASVTNELKATLLRNVYEQ